MNMSSGGYAAGSPPPLLGPSVGYVYDSTHLGHETGQHEENPHRLLEIMRLLEETGLINELTHIEGRAASVDELTLVHTREHIAALERYAKRGGGWLTLDTFMAPGSYEAALHAVGGTIVAMEAVLEGRVQSAFALVRPPGHHARPAEAMGFCFFNNIAVAVRQCQVKHGLGRALIVDFDVHHGNGTQEIFYSDPSVLYFSVHQYPFYPGTGGLEEIGSGLGQGYTVNVPLPMGCGDGEYERVFSIILMPVARRFRPEVIVVSAGYDPHWADPLASMRVTVPGFGSLVRILRDLAAELCQGRLVLVLEGGYNRRALAASVKASFDVLLGREPTPTDPVGSPPVKRAPYIEPILSRAREIHGL